LNTSYEPPRVPPKTRVRVLAIDDQLQNRWDKVLLWLLGVTEGKEIGLSVQKFTRMAKESNGLNVYGALSAEPLIGRLKQAPFDTRDYNFCYLNESNDTPIPELIVLDLRLNSAITSGNLQKQRDDILALVKLAQEKKIPSCQSLAWVGISDKELSIIKKWCEGKDSSDLAEAQSLTLLPRLLALATPLTPIILFSSTARADIKALLNPYRSIFTAFEKPRVLVAACKHKSQDLQTSVFSARIICKYPPPSTRIKCKSAHIICKQPANIAQDPHYLQIKYNL
jgi:hypothetical protein